MPNVDRKWLPPALIVAAIAASVAVYAQLPEMVSLRLDGLVPFELPKDDEPAPRWVAAFLVPALTLVVWMGFRLAPTAAGQRFARVLFRNAQEQVTQPEQFERFGKTYDAIVLAVVLLLLGIHAALLAAVLTDSGIGARIASIVLGGCLLLMGNVMPRLRPNWVAGVRTRRTLEDPQLWRVTHRVLGTALVVSGLITIVVGLAAPQYGFVTGIAMLLASCVVAGVASLRAKAVAPV
ncbi:MAG: SdpI family protein [Gemmatimonadaceae bacterium]